ncbi:MAG TPA: 3'-5' exonuclease [Dehalococcoidia bacterium]|nr:3'-5' exonuclease [Dehalococcoidia bacterium]
MKNISLTKPLAVIDLETTGTRYYADRIVEFSVLKIYPDGTEEYKSRRVNPQIEIPVGASNVHGITNEDVKNEPTFRQLAKGIVEFLEGCDLCGFNVLDFDLPLLEYEFERAGISFSRENRYIVDTMSIFHMNIPYDPSMSRNLESAYGYYCDKELKNAHSAENDVIACAQILDAQVAVYEDLPRDIPGLCKVCTKSREGYIDLVGKFAWVNDEACFTFGKHNGRLLREISEKYPDYLGWMINQDFSPEVISIVANALQGVFPEKD